MEDLEKIRRKKLRAMQEAQATREAQGAYDKEARAVEQLYQLEAQIKSRMTKAAIERFGNIKASDASRALELLGLLGRLIQQGKVAIIDDKILKSILQQTAPQKNDFKIIRK